jgi:hypothetical protein
MSNGFVVTYPTEKHLFRIFVILSSPHGVPSSVQ